MSRIHRIALLTALASGACAPSALAANEPTTVIRTSAQPVFNEGYFQSPQGAKVTFDALMSDPGGGSNVTKVEFDLNGNGVYDYTSTNVLDQASWTYSELGPRRTIKARVTNTFGKTDEAEIKLHVNPAPKPALAFNPQPATAGKPVVLDGSGSTDDEGGLTYRFDVDGSGTFGAAQASPKLTHTYATAGTKTVRIKVIDRFGQENVLNRDLVVQPAPAAATPTPTPAPTTTPAATPVTRILSTRVRLSGKRVILALTCDGQAPCAGELVLAGAGRARYEVDPGARIGVRVTINKKTRKRIKRRGSVTTTATAGATTATVTIVK